MKKLGDIYRTALITGGTSGLGLAFSKMLAGEGVKVVSVSRNPDLLPKVKGLTGVSLDLANMASVRDFVEGYLTSPGVPDLLVNNAGYGVFSDWGKFPENEITRQIDVLLAAPILLSRAFAPKMVDRGSGGIVNLSSIAGIFPLPYMPLYNAAKAGLSAFSASLALEYEEVPFVTDFRLGDFRTNFNEAVIKKSVRGNDCRQVQAWSQIEKQLDSSPEPIVAARALHRILLRRQGGVIYSGGFFQARVAPLLFRLAPSGFLRTVLRYWYKL
ncbi:MAG: short-chain dehydrogenase [Opitutae bacterium]|nr:short-chain dehydrogenase [Opitutae bacterium]